MYKKQEKGVQSNGKLKRVHIKPKASEPAAKAAQESCGQFHCSTEKRKVNRLFERILKKMKGGYKP
jgi:hypothetical protein